MDSTDLFKQLPGEIWTLILAQLRPKERIIFACKLNVVLRSFFVTKVNWQIFINSEFWQYASFEQFCKRERVTYNQNYPEFNPIIRRRTTFAKYWMLVREEHIAEFIMPSSGTCDSPEQLAKRFPRYIGKVYLSVVRRCDQPKERGWRWHKWGEYYGELRPKSLGGYSFEPEYLYQANGKRGMPRIDETWVFDRHNERHGEKYRFNKGVIVKRPGDK